jgi:hypothetical protein
MSYFLKIYQNQNEKLIAITDSNLIGAKFKHNGVNMSISSRFYGDLEYSTDEVEIEIKSATSINAIGIDICNLLIESGYCHPDTILWMDFEDKKIGHVIVVKQ